MARIALLAGKKFGRLRVIRDSGFRINGHVYWLTQCSCGREKLIRSQSLTEKITQSCGCLGAERLKQFAGSARTHGAMARDASPGVRGAYISWANMLARCSNPKHPAFENYGGRGIKVCKRWQGRKGFAHFLADMGERPEGLTLDRRRVNRGYSKRNCRWATDYEQAHNRRCSQSVTRPTGCEPIAPGAEC
jgi:hypothetical protein